MQGRMTVKKCMSMRIESTTPIICGFEPWCARSCSHYPNDITSHRIDPRGAVQVRILGSRRWVRKEQWMDTREAWNSIEDWEEPLTSDRKDSDAGERSTEGGAEMKNVTHVSGGAISEPQKGVYDDVLRPKHYASGGIECIDAIRAATNIPGMTAYQGFLAGNVMKYLWRHPLKGNAEKDLAKAEWYLKKLRESYSGGVAC